MKARVKNLLDRDDDMAIWFQALCESGTQAIRPRRGR